MDQAEVIVRKAVSADHNHIIRTWMLGAYWGSSYFREMEQNRFCKHYEEHIKCCMSKAQMRVACLKDEEDFSIGFVVHSGPIVHWIYVRPDYRNKGICNLLLGKEKYEFASSITPPGADISRKKNWIIDPFIKEI